MDGTGAEGGFPTDLPDCWCILLSFSDYSHCVLLHPIQSAVCLYSLCVTTSGLSQQLLQKQRTFKLTESGKTDKRVKESWRSANKFAPKMCFAKQFICNSNRIVSSFSLVTDTLLVPSLDKTAYEFHSEVQSGETIFPPRTKPEEWADPWRHERARCQLCCSKSDARRTGPIRQLGMVPSWLLLLYNLHDVH